MSNSEQVRSHCPRPQPSNFRRHPSFRRTASAERWWTDSASIMDKVQQWVRSALARPPFTDAGIQAVEDQLQRLRVPTAQTVLPEHNQSTASDTPEHSQSTASDTPEHGQSTASDTPEHSLSTEERRPKVRRVSWRYPNETVYIIPAQTKRHLSVTRRSGQRC
jgi:hypothetical protein